MVTVEDAAGDPVTTDNSTVTIGLAPAVRPAAAPETLSTCTSTGEKNGVFTFNGCTINTAGLGYKLVATDGQLTSATSAPFTVSTGPATQIVFTTEPTNAIGGSAFVTQPMVTIEDAGGNTVTTDTHAIALAIHSGPAAPFRAARQRTPQEWSVSAAAPINTAGTYTLTCHRCG